MHLNPLLQDDQAKSRTHLALETIKAASAARQARAQQLNELMTSSRLAKGICLKSYEAMQSRIATNNQLLAPEIMDTLVEVAAKGL